MSLLTSLMIIPILLLVAVPLGFFAAITTALAFSTLFLRVSLVYVELGAVLLQNRFVKTIEHHSPQQSQGPTSIQATNVEGPSWNKRKGSAGSGLSNGSLTPIAPVETSGLGIYAGTGPDRDFEGVGGWRLTGSKDEDELWASMNSRLELPSPMFGEQQRRRHHRRSSTAGSISTSKKISPVQSRARTPLSSKAPGTAPSEYFSSRRAASRSTTSLNVDAIARAFTREGSSNSTRSSKSFRKQQANTVHT